MNRVAAATAFLLAACGTGSSVVLPDGADPAAQVYREHCGSCHRLRIPSEQTRDRWAWAVDRFGGRAHLSPDEKQMVLAYLQAHASDAGSGGSR
jgi:mono/diheme cytochrome c family protein